MKHKIIEILKRYSIIRGGKEDGVYQVYDIKDWTNKKGLNMAKEIETLLKEREQEVAKDICTLIDKIELHSTTSLEEWKQYKHIRNKIRDTYKVII